MNFKPAQCCRGCLAEVQARHAHSFGWPEIRDLFRECTSLPIPMDESDRDLPQQICEDCYTKCEQWYSFRTMCHEIDTHLRSLPKLKTEIKLEPICIDSDDEEEELNFGELEADEDDEDGEYEEPDDLDNAEPVVLVQKIKQSKWQHPEPTTAMTQEENLQWICPVCDSQFPQTILLRDHFMEHITEDNPQCPTCDKPFNRSSKVYPHFLSEHMNQMKSQRKAESPAPQKTLNVKMPRRTYQTIPPASTKAGQKCPLCSVTTPSLSSHIANKHIHGESRQCPLCDRSWSSIGRLMTHLKVHTGEKPFQCPNCPRTFTTNTALKVHLRNDHELEMGTTTTKSKGMFRCNDCPSTFQSKWTLQAHQILHSKSEKPHQCAHCEEGYTEIRNIERHMKKMHADKWQEWLSESAEPLPCPECELTFKTPWRLKTHMTAHTDKCACPDCGRKFIQISAVRGHQRHMRLKNDKQHRSIIPDARFAEFKKAYNSRPPTVSMSVKKKMKMHPQVIKIKKPSSPSTPGVACPRCDRTFTTRSILGKHLIRIHGEGELPHKCNQCGKRFSAPSFLKRHVSTHSDVKEFPCRYCGRRFGHVYGQRQHENHRCLVGGGMG